LQCCSASLGWPACRDASAACRLAWASAVAMGCPTLVRPPSIAQIGCAGVSHNTDCWALAGPVKLDSPL
jgi:hypothetical protein